MIFEALLEQFKPLIASERLGFFFSKKNQGQVVSGGNEKVALGDYYWFKEDRWGQAAESRPSFWARERDGTQDIIDEMSVTMQSPVQWGRWDYLLTLDTEIAVLSVS